MKEITINNREYYYEVFGESPFTRFYLKEKYFGKKYIFFGKTIEKERYSCQFTFNGDVGYFSNTEKQKLKDFEIAYFNLINNIKQNI